MLNLKTPRIKDQAKQIDVIECADGKRLKVMSIKVPEPGFTTGTCGPKPVTHVDLEHVTALLWAACAESESWRQILDEVLDGLGTQCVGEREVGATWQGFAGFDLRVQVMTDASAGLLGLLLRAPFIRGAQARQAFRANYTSQEGRQKMARAAAFLDEPRPNASMPPDSEYQGPNAGRDAADDALDKMLNRYGLELRPEGVEDRFPALHALHDLIHVTSGFIEPPPSGGLASESPEAQAMLQQIHDSAVKYTNRIKSGGCRGC